MLLSLSINDVNRMQLEFNEIYQSLFEQGYRRLDAALEIKLKTMNICEKIEEKKVKKTTVNMDEFKNAFKKQCKGHNHDHDQIKVFEISTLGEDQPEDGHCHGHKIPEVEEKHDHSEEKSSDSHSHQDHSEEEEK